MKGDNPMWSVWDKKSEINGCSAEHIFKTFTHLASEETIFIKTTLGRVNRIEGKRILAGNHNIDINLDNEAFIAEYERRLVELEEAEEPVEKPGEE
jgi:hypothetical protein